MTWSPVAVKILRVLGQLVLKDPDAKAQKLIQYRVILNESGFITLTKSKTECNTQLNGAQTTQSDIGLTCVLFLLRILLPRAC